MNMKKLIESMDRIEECGMTEMPAAMPAPENPGNPVTMSVSLNASGKEHVDDLINMMKNAGMGAAEPVSAKTLSPRMDMERLSGIMGEPEDGLDDREMNLPAIADLDGGEDESYAAEMDDEEAMAGGITKDSVKKSALELLVDIAKTSKQYKGEITDDQVRYLGSLVHDFDMAGIETEKYSEIEKLFRTASKTNKADMSMIQPAYAQAKTLDEEADEGYDNEPDPEYQDHKYMTKDLSGGLNREKKAYAATQDGDNAMAVEAIKAQLMKALSEKKMPMGPGPDGKKGTDDDKPAFLDQKKGDKKSKGGSKPKKGEVPPQFKK